MRFQRAGDGERTLAVFIDFENLALGFAGKRDRFQIEKVLERLVEKGKLVTKKAYADWSRFGIYAQALHEAAIELIEIPKRSITGKNSADIRLVVDAVDFAYSKDHVDTFVIVSGDSDFSPLVSKLKELGKHVIGLGLVDATSNLLRDNCDEFIYYEDLDRPQSLGFNDAPFMPEAKRKVFGLLLESLMALRRENKETIFSSMAKDTMKRKRPSFNEEYHGYRTFSELLEDAAKSGLIELEKHKGSGTYVINRFGGEMRGTQPGQVQNTQQALPHPQPLAQPSRALPAPVAPPQPPVEAPRPIQVQRPAPQQTSQFNAPASMRNASPTPLPPPPVQVAEAPKAKPEPVQQPRPAQQPRRAAPPPPPVEQDDDQDDLPKFGRSLMDEFDEDDEDELPSYGTGRNSPPANKPPERKVKPAGEQRPAQRPRQNKPPSPPPPPPPPPERAARQAAPPARPASPPPPPAPAAKPKPKPKPVEDDGFGSGLDD